MQSTVTLQDPQLRSRSWGHSVVRTVVLATVMAVAGVLFTVVPASAGPIAGGPICLRSGGEVASGCDQELKFPAGFSATSRPLHGMIFLIAGGGWQSTQPYLIPAGNIYRQASDRWLARGYAVAMVEHSDGSGVNGYGATGSTGLNNVLKWYDHYRKFWNGLAGYGQDFPICASGFSSGGHFSLMLGAYRPSLDCIVTEAPPSRLDYLARADGAPTHAPGLRQDVQDLADAVFSGRIGVSPSNGWSPQTLRAQIRMPVLIGHANNDLLVLPSQTQRFCNVSLPNCRAVYLPGSSVGVADFTHANVDDRALANFRATERSFVCAVVSPFTGPCT